MSTIRTVERAIQIIQVISQHPSGIGINALAAELALAKSTVSRLVATLEQHDVVQRTELGKYAIGNAPIQWVSQRSYSDVLSVRALPVLQHIAAETGEACTLCVLDGNNVLYLQQMQSQQDIQVRDWTGAQLPLHVTSAGKVLLAYASKTHLDDYLSNPITAYTKHTVTDSAMLNAQLASIRQQGYSYVSQEHAEGIVGIAVPVYNKRNIVIAALCIYGPEFRFDKTTIEATVALMKEQAEKLVG